MGGGGAGGRKVPGFEGGAGTAATVGAAVRDTDPSRVRPALCSAASSPEDWVTLATEADSAAAAAELLAMTVNETVTPPPPGDVIVPVTRIELSRTRSCTARVAANALRGDEPDAELEKLDVL